MIKTDHKATLYSFAAGAGVDEADLKFNNALYKNIWENSTGTNYHGAFIADVTSLLLQQMPFH